MSTKFQQAIAAIEAKDIETGKHLLAELIRENPNNQDTLLAMSYIVDSAQQRQQILSHLLKINPNHSVAKRELANLTGGATSSVTPPPAPTSMPSISLKSPAKSTPKPPPPTKKPPLKPDPVPPKSPKHIRPGQPRPRVQQKKTHLSRIIQPQALK